MYSPFAMAPVTIAGAFLFAAALLSHAARGTASTTSGHHGNLDTPDKHLHAQQQQHHLELRSLRDIPFPRTVDAGIALQAEAMRRSRRTERLNGHFRKVAAAPAPGMAVSRSRRSTTNTRAINHANTAISPVDFGADPNGAKDSSAAFAAALVVLLKARGPRHTMAANITDLGGATLDLSGGTSLCL